MSFSEEQDRRRDEFLALLKSLGSVTLAARELGINRNTGFTWARKAGFASGGKFPARPHPRQSEYAQLRADGVARRKAAAQVGIHERTARDWDHGVRHSRNSRFYPDGRRVDYTTGRTTMESMTSPPSTVPEQVGSHPGRLREYVSAKLSLQWSPQQIRNRIREDFPDDEDMRVSAETIYQARPAADSNARSQRRGALAGRAGNRTGRPSNARAGSLTRWS